MYNSKQGCDGNVCDIHGKTASMAAAQLGSLDVLNKLIEYGCALGQSDLNEWDTLCYCLVEETENHYACLQRCLEEDGATFTKSIAIILALEKKELGLIAAREILENIKDPNVIHRINKRSALSYAAEYKLVIKQSEGDLHIDNFLNRNGKQLRVVIVQTLQISTIQV